MARREPGEFLDGFGALSRCLRTVVAEAYAELGLGSTQAKFLRHVGRRSRTSQADLARATLTDPALTGRVLASLIERGWVRRTRSEDDRRQYLLELSPAGERASRKVEEARANVAARVARALDARDLADFERIGRKIRAAFEETDEARQPAAR